MSYFSSSRSSSWSSSLAIARRRRALGIALAIVGLGGGLALTACGGDAGFAGGFGATPGGAQDMGLARELIAEGVVPPAEAFVVEGMFSEHDLPITGGACERTLCVDGAGAIAPDLEGEASAWLQVGLSSTVDPETFVRPPLTIIATVDVSGSMGWRTGPGAPGEVSRSFLHALVDELGAGDAFAMVTYGSAVAVPVATTEVASGEGIALGPLHSAIDALDEGGVTNMEAGLVRAFELARAARAATPERDVRVVLFTDVQPNVGATGASEFEAMAGSAAADGVGLTVLGVGTGIGQEVMLAMSHLRGGNAFTMFDQEDVPALMEDSWPWMAAPIAFDLSLEVKTHEGVSIERGLGFPGAPSAADTLDLDVATVFLSRRRGALLVQLRALQLAALEGATVSLHLEYDEPDGTHVDQPIAITLPRLAEGATEAHAQPVTARTIALALLVDGMRDAATLYASDRPAAIARMTSTRNRIAAAAASTEDAGLATEAELADALLALMEAGARQGTLYGYGY
ncbi:MAG: VWA domain-containing protein [Myxococcota bacterium]|nr:VWA domain-containing protein [Myxococcota bacterium]